MRNVCLAILLMIGKIGLSQPNKVDSTKIYINRLNWQSFEITINYVPTPYLLNDANRLISIKDNNKIKELMRSLTIDSKTIVIHMILTRLLEKEKHDFQYKYIYGKDSTVTEVVYTFNGVSWNWSEKLGCSINKENINFTRNYWSKRLGSISK